MGRLMFFSFVIASIIYISNGYPHIGIDTQDAEEMQPNVSELDYYPENIIPYSEKLQLLLRQPKTANTWNNVLRVPETKRQVRYRQCYFNPVSCF